MSAFGDMFRNSVGLVFTLFVVRLLDSLSTVVLSGERLSTKISNAIGGDQ